MCGECHYLYEYHKELYIGKFGKLPKIEDAEKLYNKYLELKGKSDIRTQEQMAPI